MTVSEIQSADANRRQRKDQLKIWFAKFADVHNNMTVAG